MSSILIVATLLASATTVSAWTNVGSLPAGTGNCVGRSGALQGDLGRNYWSRGGHCSCPNGNTYYCDGSGNNCQALSGSRNCNYGPFTRRHYNARSWCWCYVPGCSVGHRGPAGACKQCAAGQYQGQNQYTGTQCHSCNAGQYQPSKGQASCGQCSAGQYQQSTGQAGCNLCPAGQYQNQNGKTGCKACGSGQYQNQNGKSSCKSCGVGQYQNQNQQNGCKNCGKGQYQNQNKGSGCKNCGGGQYQNQNGGSGCKNCGAGTYQNQNGQTNCKTCNRGYYQNQGGTSACKSCPKGWAESRYGSSSCESECTCGYYCPAGSINNQAEVCGRDEEPNFYCPKGTKERIQITDGYQGTPVSDNPERYCSEQKCPDGFKCEKGIKKSNLEWASPSGCKGGSHTATVEEETEGPFGSDFSVKPHYQMDTADYSISYEITKQGKLYKNACDGGTAGGNWLGTVASATGTKPSLNHVKLKAKKEINAEECRTPFPAEITATLKDKNSAIRGQITCSLEVAVEDINEPPKIVDNGPNAYTVRRKVSEDKLPGHPINPKLDATDPEADVGLQQLTWEVISCKGKNAPRQTNPGNYVNISPCHIKLSACDGQLSVASGAELNYEVYTEYKLEVQVHDDGTNPSSKSSARRYVYVDVIPKNDPPEVEPIQVFFIRENTISGYVNLKNNAGNACDDPQSRCRVLATDPDSDKNGFQFDQTSGTSSAPFLLTKDAVGGEFDTNAKMYKLWTNIAVLSTAQLDYESGNTQFDLIYNALDGDGGTSSTSGMVTIKVIDDNDKPRLNLPHKCDGELCVFIDENNQEGSGSQRYVDLEPFTLDEDQKSNWQCCDSTKPYELLTASQSSIKQCDITQFTETKQGFYANAMSFNFEPEKTVSGTSVGHDTCEIIVRVYDKEGGAKGTRDHTVRVVVNDINDPPHDVKMRGSCEIAENSAVNQVLASNDCQLLAEDEDDTIFTFMKEAPPCSDGACSSGDQGSKWGSTSWNDIDYFSVGEAGTFIVSNPPDYEIATRVSFKVYARDDRGRDSDLEAIEIKIIDVNEPPIIDDTMSPLDMSLYDTSGGGDNKVCGATFFMDEFQKKGDELILGQTPSALMNAPSGGSFLSFTATEQDVPHADAPSGWSTFSYSLTPGYKDSDLFEINTDGTIKPLLSAMENIDYERMQSHLANREGRPDGQLRINAFAIDGGNPPLKADCDIYVVVKDINEPPVINHIKIQDVNQMYNHGESEDHPFYFQTSNIKIGMVVGDRLPAQDFDTGQNDEAFCEVTPGVTSDDSELFGISKNCEIYVKAKTSGSKDITSSGGKFTLSVRAYDKGWGGENPPNILRSDSRVYHLKGLAALKSPVFNLLPSNANPIMFSSRENVAGVVDNQEAVSDFSFPAGRDFSFWTKQPPEGYWENPPSYVSALFAACTDDNVYQRYTVESQKEEKATNDDCASLTIDNCKGEVSDISRCEIVGGDCKPRQASLRFKVTPKSTYPKIAGVNASTIEINVGRLSGEISLSATTLGEDVSSIKPNYEDLIYPNDDLKCSLGAPVRVGPKDSSSWIGLFPNGVAGICRLFDRETIEADEKKDKLSYLDAAAFCAKAGARLPLLSELQTAANTPSAPRAKSTASNTSPNPGFPDSYGDGGWDEDGGAWPFRAMNIHDTWYWPTDEISYATLLGNKGCRSGKVCPDKSKIDEPVKVWTYSGEQVSISGESSDTVDLYAQSSAKATVQLVDETYSMQEALPVLCFVGTDYINQDWIGDESTTNAARNKASKPRVGLSALVQCMDTSDFTVNEEKFNYAPQPMRDEKYVFVEITDEEESPRFVESEVSVYINENDPIGTVVFEAEAFDEDPGQASQLKFSLVENGVQTNYFSKGTLSDELPAGKSRRMPIKINVDLDFEAMAIHTLSIDVEDLTQNTAKQTLIVHLIDQNEPPILRDPTSPTIAVGAYPLSFATYEIKESAVSGDLVGNLLAWDPDINNRLEFSVSGSDNTFNGGPVFSGQSLSDGMVKETPTGNRYAGVLTLINDEAIDYETKQSYDLTIEVSDGLLNDRAKVVVNILNVNDVTVDDVRLQAWTQNSSSSRATLKTLGGEKILITGTNFGVKYDDAPALEPIIYVTYGRADMDQSDWFSAVNCNVKNAGSENTQIVCDSASGFGANHKWRVRITTQQNIEEGDYTSDRPVITSYRVPNITSITASSDITSLDTKGNTLITLSGQNFGPLGTQLDGFYGTGTQDYEYCAKDCTVTKSHTEAQCKTRPGTGRNHVWRLGFTAHNWNGGYSPNKDGSRTSYTKPTITSVKNCDDDEVACTAYTQNMSTGELYGLTSVYITGKYFGPISHSSCDPQVRGIITANYDNIWDTSTKDFKYESVQCELTIDQTQIRCLAAAGVSKNFRWVVNVDGIESDPSTIVTYYNPPIVHGLSGPGAFGGTTAGGQKFYLRGDNFGPQISCAGTAQASDAVCIDSVTFRTMDLVNGHEFKGKNCTIQTDQTLIECESPNGVGKNMKYKIEVGSQESQYNENLKDPSAPADVVRRPGYARPVISALTRVSGPRRGEPMNDANTQGYFLSPDQGDIYGFGGKIPETVLITGLNFGPVNSATCSLSGRPCKNNAECYNVSSGNICLPDDPADIVDWNPTTGRYSAKKAPAGKSIPDSYSATNCIVTKDHTEMMCDFAEGAGKSHEWTVNVGLQDSLTPTSSYHIPILKEVQGDGSCDGSCAPRDGYVTNGRQQVMLIGSNFGPYPDGATVSYGKSGIEYTPTDCTVLNHSAIRCFTVPGIGRELLWKITVRQQSNELGATTSYASPYIHSVTPSTASADGSKKRGFVLYLNVSNSGLADPLTKRVVQMDKACLAYKEKSCGMYEIPEMPLGPDGTRAEGKFDIIAFRLPMLLNKKPAVQIPIRLVVYPVDRETGLANRADSVPSSNTVPFTYNKPVIDQIIVEDHETSTNQLLIRLIGRNFGSINVGEFVDPNLNKDMEVLSIPEACSEEASTGAINCPSGSESIINMQLDANISYGPIGTYVQKWERGAQSERYDEVIVIWEYQPEFQPSGILALRRGGQVSNVVQFRQKSPVLENSLIIIEHESNGDKKKLELVPTLGSKFTNSESQRDIRMTVKCKDCGDKSLKCCTKDCLNSMTQTCNPELNCITENCQEGNVRKGVPRDIRVRIGSAQLPESELKDCPIMWGSAAWDDDAKTWTFECYLPAYQGKIVDTRVRRGLSSWSNSATTKYMPPKIESLRSSLGGTYGADFSKTIQWNSEPEDALLLVRTSGETVKITGENFGIGHHGDITRENMKNIMFDSGKTMIRPYIIGTAHDQFSVDIPAGTSGRHRSIDVRTGQFSFDFQDTSHAYNFQPRSTMYISYRKPTIVAELVPLWRFDENGAGGFTLRLYGFDFLTQAQIEFERQKDASYDHADHVSVLYKAELVNETTNEYVGTECKVTYTDYNTILCDVGKIQDPLSISALDDVSVVVNVDGQLGIGSLSRAKIKASKQAVEGGSYSEDQNTTAALSNERDKMFNKQVKDCVKVANGLSDSLRAIDTSEDDKVDSDMTVQERVFYKGREYSDLNNAEKEIYECVIVVFSAFQQACSQSWSEESEAVLEYAYTFDEQYRSPRLPNTRNDNLCRGVETAPDVGGYSGGGDSPSPGANQDPEDGGYDNILLPPVEPPSNIDDGSGSTSTLDDFPSIYDVSCQTTADFFQLPTDGGDILKVDVIRFDVFHQYEAFLEDPDKKYDPIPMYGKSGRKVITDANKTDYVQKAPSMGSVYLRVPPGQGRRRRIVLRSIKTEKHTQENSGNNLIGYAKAFINKTLTKLPVSTTTDTCRRDRYENVIFWKARKFDLGRDDPIIDGQFVDPSTIDDRMRRRRCEEHDTIVLYGGNFGENSRQLKVWVVGQEIGSDGKPTTFPVYDGSLYFEQAKMSYDVLNRGFSGSSVPFTFVHEHDHLVLRGPRGYGANLKLVIDVAGQQTEVDFSFQPPVAHSTKPDPYNGNGQEVEILGMNFGGVESNASVVINGRQCENAQWNEEHPDIGLPFISCVAQRTIVGIANVSVFVAGQQGEFVVPDAFELAGVKSVCMEEGKADAQTGKKTAFWGRNEPKGELCAECQEGTICFPDTYMPPQALAGYYIVDLDITATSRQEKPSDPESLIDKRARRDYDRALETFRHNGQRVCPPERILDSQADKDIVDKYDFALVTKRGLCPTAQPCKPVEACTGGNTCSSGYQYQQLRCDSSSARRNADGGRKVQSCNHTLQCQVLSAGARCPEAISSVCQCPPDWELGSRTCLKECVANEIKMLTLSDAGCTYELIEKSLSGLSCAYNDPEDCAICQGIGECVKQGSSCSTDTDCPDDDKCEIRDHQCECGPSTRCSLCTAGTHYRLDGKCEECPESPELVFAMFFVGIVVAIVATYILDQKKFNLAFLIIPVDYFQVLALLSRADIRWPNLLLDVLRALQFFNLNVDIATPECLLAGVFTYEMKFYGTLLAAPVFVTFLVFAYGWHQFYYRVCLRRKPDKLYSSKLVGTFMLLIYMIYLSCTTRALEIFNCSPTVPDDGWEYVGFTDATCDGGSLCRCWDPEHLPSRLIVPSLMALLGYTLGFPVFLFWLLRCGNRKSLLKEDQILRASDLGDTPETNPRAYHMRVRYHKMYYYFKPGKSYWMLLILTRKVGIAFCSLIFRTNPGFMLASVVLILFVAFSLQTRHSPYMSTSQRQLVLAEHAIKAESGDHTHLRIRNNILHVQEQVKRKNAAKSAKIKKMRFSSVGINLVGSSRQNDKITQFFFDYNTVELFLLFCAVLVCLAGIMFESDRFQQTDAADQLRYAWQRDMVTYFVILIVMISFMYLFVVILNEITGYTPRCLHFCHKNKEDAIMSAAKTIQNQKDDHVEMNIVNPAMMGSMGPDQQVEFERKMAASRQKAQKAEDEKNALLLERRKLKGLVAAQKRNQVKSSKRGGGKKFKKDFASVALHDDGRAINGNDLQAIKLADELKSSPGHRKQQSFQKHVSGDGHVYYSNTETNETVWKLPENAVVV